MRGILMNKKMSIFAETLAVGGTIYSKSAARITGDKVGADNYAIWKSKLEYAQECFYKYKRVLGLKIRNPELDITPETTNAFNALQNILDLIGEINGFKLEKSEELLSELAKYAVVETTELIGEAFTIKSELDNCNDDLKRSGYDEETGKGYNGINAEYLADLVARRNELDEALALAKKSPDSGRPIIKHKGYASFCADTERKLAELSEDQNMKTWEEIEAEREAKRKERRAKTKAKKAAAKKAQ
jgi:hypothetical protein